MNEKRRKRYAEMPSNLKEEILRRRREAYPVKKSQQDKLLVHNEERRKRYAEMTQTIKEHLLEKRRQAYAKKRTIENKSLTNYQSIFSKAMSTYTRKHRYYLLRKNTNQLKNSALISQHEEVQDVASSSDNLLPLQSAENASCSLP